MIVSRFILILKWIQQHTELLFWAAALVILFFLPEQKTDISLCVFSWLGLAHCPGCGIGHSIHYALQLNLSASFHHHPLGIFAVLVIFRRIKQLLYLTTKLYEA